MMSGQDMQENIENIRGYFFFIFLVVVVLDLEFNDITVEKWAWKVRTIRTRTDEYLTNYYGLDAHKLKRGLKISSYYLTSY